MTKTTITEGGNVLHKSNCDCDVCRELRNGTECEQCDGPVLIKENEKCYSRVCQYCGASGVVLKSELE